MRFRLYAAFAVFAALAAAPALAQQQITVFAAASLKNTLDDANAAFTKAGGPKVTASYAASSRAADRSSVGGTRRLMKPNSRQAAAGYAFPVSTISRARFEPIFLGASCVPPLGIGPSVMNTSVV